MCWRPGVVFGFKWRATYFGSLRAKLNLAPLGMPNRVWPQWTDIECSSLKPPHYLQACSEILLNMEGVLCNNQLPTKGHVELEDNFIISFTFNSVFSYYYCRPFSPLDLNRSNQFYSLTGQGRFLICSQNACQSCMWILNQPQSQLLMSQLREK